MRQLALLFPGQGSQYVGMGKHLSETGYTGVVKAVFEEANDVLGFDLKKLCFHGDRNKLAETENTQPAVLAVSIAIFRVYLQKFGILPRCAAGHSLGEYSALTCAGAITFSDALRMVRKRGQLMQEAVAPGEGTMIAVSGFSAQDVEHECRTLSSPGNLAVISSYNAPLQQVISGHKAAVTKLGEIFTQRGARVVPLEVSTPFHSPLMEPAVEKMRQELDKYTYNEPKWDVISNVMALPHQGKHHIVENLARQLTEPVRWQDTMQYINRLGVELVLEIGPKKVLKNLAVKNLQRISAYSLDLPKDMAASECAVSDNPAKIIGKAMVMAITTKNRNPNHQEFQEGFVKPYRAFKQVVLQLEETGTLPTVNHVDQALNMLKTVFDTKKVPSPEQEEIFNLIYR